MRHARLLIGGLCFLLVPALALAGGGGAATKKKEHWTVPVLMYHYIEDPKFAPTPLGKRLSVSPARFKTQLDWLAARGYGTVSFAALASGALLPAKPIILSFDDGYQDAFDNAFPILKAHGMTGTFYIVTGKVGTPGYLTWDEILAMHAGGMEMGAHTVTHANLAGLAKEKEKAEIEASEQTLTQKLGIPVVTFAYPFGKYKADTEKLVKASGIRYAVTTHNGVANAREDLFALPRLRMTNATNMAALLRSSKTK